MRNSGITIALSGAVLTALAQIFLKKGMNIFSLVFLDIFANRYLIAGSILYFIASVTLLIALKYGELSVLYPIYATSYIWVTLLSVEFLNETFDFLKLMGVFFILLGVIFVTKGEK